MTTTTITALTDTEFETLLDMVRTAEDRFLDEGMGLRTAFRYVFRWIARRGISEADFWAWMDD